MENDPIWLIFQLGWSHQTVYNIEDFVADVDILFPFYGSQSSENLGRYCHGLGLCNVWGCPFSQLRSPNPKNVPWFFVLTCWLLLWRGTAQVMRYCVLFFRLKFTGMYINNIHIIIYIYIYMNTLPKLNIAPEHRPSKKKKTNLPRCFVSFREGIYIYIDIYLENKLLLISINFTPKTSHSRLKKDGTLCFPGTYNNNILIGKTKTPVFFQLIIQTWELPCCPGSYLDGSDVYIRS